MFFQIHNADTFWAWTKKYLVPAMYEVKWYNGQAFEYKDGFISDLSGYLVGMPRFRQLRVKPGEYNFIRSPTSFPMSLPYRQGKEKETLGSQPLLATVRSTRAEQFSFAVLLLETSSTISFQFTIFQGITLHVRNFLTLYITLED